MAVITRWSLKRGGRKAGFHCNSIMSLFSASKRGKGARVKGNFHLKRGDVLKILVGQEGGVNTASGGAGGGGGTFVVTDDNTPLLIGEYFTVIFISLKKI